MNRVWKFHRRNERTVAYEVLARFEGAEEADDEADLRKYFQVY
jgi:hypothetical protein